MAGHGRQATFQAVASLPPAEEQAATACSPAAAHHPQQSAAMGGPAEAVQGCHPAQARQQGRALAARPSLAGVRCSLLVVCRLEP